MANNDSATPITTGSVTGKPKERGIYYFKLGSEYFLYDEDEQRLCGLTGAEIDSNFHFLSGFDIKDVKITDSGSSVVITRVNEDDFSAITLNLAEVRPELHFDKETGVLTMIYPDGEVRIADGFFVDFNDEGKYNIKIYTDGTINGLGTEYSPLSLSRLERTGTFAPVETLIESGDTEEYKGRRILTKELIDDYGHLYSYDEVEAIQAALEAQNSPWRVATKADWDELLNAMEKEESDRNHDDCKVDRREEFHGFAAGDMLKSTSHWSADSTTNVNLEEHEYNGFGVLPVGVRPYRANLITDEENDIEGFGELSAFWVLRSSADTCGEGDPFVKIFSKGFGGVAQKRPDEDDAYSVRLVKECEPGCPEQYETILGSTYPVGPITSPCGVDYCKIWTLSNFYSKGVDFSGSVISGASVPPQTEYAYFINECDGTKKRMMEGESVVILDRCRHEWRIIDGELVDTYEEVRKDIAELSGNVVNFVNELSAGTVTEFENVRNEIVDLSANTVSAISEVRSVLTERIVSVSETLERHIAESDSAFTEVNSRLTDEIIRATDAEDGLLDSIESLSSSTEQHFTEANTALSDEKARAMAEEESLSERITENLGAIEQLISDVEDNSSDISETNDLLLQLSGTVESYHSSNVQEMRTIASNVSSNVIRIDNSILDTNTNVEELSGATAIISDTLSDTIDELYGVQSELENNIASTSAATLEEAKTYADEQANAINAVKVNDLYFDNLSKYIKLVKADGSLTDGIPAEDFLKDSVLTSVEFDEGNERLIFVWNDDYNTRTYIPLTKLSNVYGVGQDSLAFLKMSGTNISAIVDKADGFEKTLATTKFVEDMGSAMTAVIGELVEANNENREDIDTLNGDKSVAGSVEHKMDDKFNTALLTAGLPVTTISVDDARNHSLLRSIIANGETKYFVSNNAKDMLTEDNGGYTISVNHYLNSLEERVAALETENELLKNRIDELEDAALKEADIKNIIKNYLVGTDREISITDNGGTLKVGFDNNAVFGEL